MRRDIRRGLSCTLPGFYPSTHNLLTRPVQFLSADRDRWSSRNKQRKPVVLSPRRDRGHSRRNDGNSLSPDDPANFADPIVAEAIMSPADIDCKDPEEQCRADADRQN